MRVQIPPDAYIYEKEADGFLFLLIYRKLLIVWRYATKNCFSNLAKQSAGFAFLIGLRCQRVFYPNRKLLIGSINFSIPAGGKFSMKRKMWSCMETQKHVIPFIDDQLSISDLGCFFVFIWSIVRIARKSMTYTIRC